MIGDANSWLTIVAAASFIGLGVLSTDVYVENGGVGPDGNALQWYVNTARFYGQIRNIKTDICATDPGAYVCALRYQVVQTTTIESVKLISDSTTVCSNPTHQGLFAENGSGGVMSDITFTGGNYSHVQGWAVALYQKASGYFDNMWLWRVVFDLGGMGMGWRELGFPGERVSVALVITGSEQYGSIVDLDNGRLVSKDQRYWSADKLNKFYVKLEDSSNRCVGLTNTPKFDMQPMKNFMDKNGGKGCVLLLADGRLQTGLSTDRVAFGIYSCNSYLNNDDFGPKISIPRRIPTSRFSKCKVIPAMMDHCQAPPQTTTSLCSGNAPPNRRNRTWPANPGADRQPGDKPNSLPL
ncbi:hypothetical protein V502_08262 [Pseudogymnoascus sp. VKM F-4520 (FW-2644)]|nr:hypothetical protein V502_08262 [Pseudogymnoascus sp. VKM F-4520 (FW-2644)]